MSLDTLIKVSDCLHISHDYLIRETILETNTQKDETKLQQLINKCSQK